MPADRMELWVEEIIAPDVIAVSPAWRFGGMTGREIRISGLVVPQSSQKAAILKERLAEQVLGQAIEVGPPYAITTDRRLECHVYIGEKKLTTTLLDRRAHA